MHMVERASYLQLRAPPSTFSSSSDNEINFQLNGTQKNRNARALTCIHNKNEQKQNSVKTQSDQRNVYNLIVRVSFYEMESPWKWKRI